jgi:hypothetical protein
MSIWRILLIVGGLCFLVTMPSVIIDIQLRQGQKQAQMLEAPKTWSQKADYGRIDYERANKIWGQRHAC